MSVRKRTVLLLEDDPIQVMLFQGMASDIATGLVSADNVFDAIRTIKSSPVAACVVDLGVYRKFREYDEGAGIEFIAEARQLAEPGMPIIVVSGTRDPAVLIPCFEAGCDDYVLKSEGIEGAVARLRSWIRMLPLPVQEMQEKRAEVLTTLRQALKR